VLTTPVVINAAPSANASSNSPLCEGATLNLSAIGGSTYSWTGPNGFASSSQNPSVTTVTQADGGMYTVVVTGTGGCTASQSITVIVETTPVATCDNNNPDCPGDPLMLIASGGTTYAWTGPNGFTSTEQNPVITNATTASSGTYFVIVSTAAGCSASAQTLVTYPQPIVISGVVSQSPTDHMGSIDVTASGGQLPYTFLWSNGATTEDVTGLFSGTYIVILTDAGLCNAADTFVVDIPLVIPNVITPNSDGKNDDFEIINIGAYKEIVLEIYNRWGDLLFRFDGTGAQYASPSSRWDGKHNGKDLPMGSYLYILTLDDLDPLSGAVLLKY
jgi:gliding motility-associated-like protein